MTPSPSQFKKSIRLAIFLGFSLFLSLGSIDARAQEAFNFDTVKALAKDLLSRPFNPNENEISADFPKLNYELHHQLLFQKEQALWSKDNLPFNLEFFPLGWLFKRDIPIYEVVDGKAKKIDFKKDFFTTIYDEKKQPINIPQGMAGFRIAGQLGPGAKKEEFFVFLGASYFRALAEGMGYGLSTRGVAVNTVQAKGEEFPLFTKFWVVRPKADDLVLNVYALMDGPSLTGAYHFTIIPGARTSAVIRASVFMRNPVDLLGFTPLTSMFWYGKNSFPKPQDYRPQVHDSDGLLIADKSGEWIWRPLNTSPSIRHCSFHTKTLAGFGLINRDRDFVNYQDLGAHNENRTSIWVEPIGDWGQGAVHLVEIPTNNEYMDNVISFWAPTMPLEAGKQIDMAYKLTWFKETEYISPVGRVIATRRTSTSLNRETNTSTYAAYDPQDRHDFVIDFAPIKGVPLDENKRPEIVFDHGPGVDVVNKFVVVNTATGGWRVFVQLKFANNYQPVEMNLKLTYNGKVVSEKWNYYWKP